MCFESWFWNETLSKSLFSISRTCINKWVFLETGKISQVIPIFKESKKDDVRCNKPTSLLCCSEAFEKFALIKDTAGSGIYYTTVSVVSVNREVQQYNYYS